MTLKIHIHIRLSTFCVQATPNSCKIDKNSIRHLIAKESGIAASNWLRFLRLSVL
jgi:hypothetical protein